MGLGGSAKEACCSAVMQPHNASAKLTAIERRQNITHVTFAGRNQGGADIAPECAQIWACEGGDDQIFRGVTIRQHCTQRPGLCVGVAAGRGGGTEILSGISCSAARSLVIQRCSRLVAGKFILSKTSTTEPLQIVLNQFASIRSSKKGYVVRGLAYERKREFERALVDFRIGRPMGPNTCKGVRAWPGKGVPGGLQALETGRQQASRRKVRA